MISRYREALSEVEYIINSFEKEEIESIPLRFREFISQNKDRHYKVDISLTEPPEEQNIKKETLAILSFIYRKYLASAEEKKYLDEKFE